ncbi:MAG: hypothetical protein IPF87_12805 [Gemmatimonadetes bacterium]|nr:hypothetical protein [Gemmatimonadota bacterium]
MPTIAIAVACIATVLLTQLVPIWKAERAAFEAMRGTVAAQHELASRRAALERLVHDAARTRSRVARLLVATDATTAVTELASIVHRSTPSELNGVVQVVVEDDTVHRDDLRRASVRVHAAGATESLVVLLHNLLSDAVQLRVDPLRLESSPAVAENAQQVDVSMDASVSAWYRTRARW